MNARYVLMTCILAMSTASAIACGPQQPEDFSVFFKNFTSNKNFSMDRTIYPSMRIRYEYRLDSGKQEITETHRKVTRQEDRKYLALQEYVATNRLTIGRPEVTQNDAEVEISSPDWQLNYHFALRQGCWFLHEIQQHVMQDIVPNHIRAQAD